MTKIEDFRMHIETSIVKHRKVYLRRAKEDVYDFDKWVKTWDLDLISQGSMDRVFDAKAHIRANRLDGDRKVCVELLNQFFNYCTLYKTSPTIAKQHFPPRFVEDFLSLTLEFDRAKALYFMPWTGEPGKCGMHWYSQADVDDDPEWNRIARAYRQSLDFQMLYLVSCTLPTTLDHSKNDKVDERQPARQQDAQALVSPAVTTSITREYTDSNSTLGDMMNAKLDSNFKK